MRGLLRWIARIASLVAAVTFAVLWYRQPPLYHALATITLVQLALISAGVIGLLLGWWKERLGGVVALTGFLGGLLLEAIASKRFPLVPALFAMMLPALLYLVVSRPRRRSSVAGA